MSPVPGTPPPGGAPLVLDLRAAAEKALADTLPPDKHTAVLVGFETVEGQSVARVGFATKIGDHWSLADEFQWGQGVGLSNQLTIMGSW